MRPLIIHKNGLKAIQNKNIYLFMNFRGKVAFKSSKSMVKMPKLLVNNKNLQYIVYSMFVFLFKC